MKDKKIKIMNDKIIKILEKYGVAKAKRQDALVEILFLLAENTVDVSASEGESDVLHVVAECNTERSSTNELNEEDVEGTLQKRIDLKEDCFSCKFKENLMSVEPCISCGEIESNYKAI